MRLKQSIIVLCIIIIVLLAATFDAVRGDENRMREHIELAFVPALTGKPINLQNQIVCKEADEVVEFFDHALAMEGQGIVRALASANRAGIMCRIGNGGVVYLGAQEPFTYESEHGDLTVTIHEVQTPKGPRFFWTTNQSGDGA